jgi:hypothetical protein
VYVLSGGFPYAFFKFLRMAVAVGKVYQNNVVYRSQIV